MMWKQVIPEMVRVDEQRTRFQGEKVLERTVRRYLRRESALATAAQLYVQRCRSQHPELEPDMSRYEKQLEGIATIDTMGEITRSDELQEWIDENAQGMDAGSERRGGKRSAPEREAPPTKRLKSIEFISGGMVNAN